jgi:hypothetical protein
VPEFDVRAKIKITRIDSDRSRLPTPSQTFGWIALGLVIAFIYWTTKALLALDRQRSAGQFEQVYLPDSLSTSRKTKIPKEAPQEFLVNPDRRLVVFWRNPNQCDKEILLSYRPSDNSEAALKTEVLPGLGGNKIFPLVGKTSWQVQWTLRNKATKELGCKNADYGSMPLDVEVFGFTENIPTFSPTKK